MENLDLFTYPNFPGAKREGTSRAAAEQVAPRAPTIRQRILTLMDGASLTADEAAAQLGISILSVRPRFSEALALGQIEDTGRTRLNDSGVAATVWRRRST